MTQTRQAFHELLQLLQEVDTRYVSLEWRIERPEDIVAAHRYTMHLLAYGLDAIFERDPERPVFQRVVWPHRKFMGDNPDAIYMVAFIRPDRTYRIRGNTAGAVYTSITAEVGTTDGLWPRGVARAISDSELQAAPDGNFEVIIGPEPRPGNWYRIDPEVGSLMTRHYFEQERPVAADPTKVIPLIIEPLDPVGAHLASDDASVAAGIRRVANLVRSTTLGQPPPFDPSKVPAWVSTVPNQFNPPDKPGLAIGASFQDAAYAMAPYALGPDEALVIEGCFPRCRFANVNVWNRYQQTHDYATRTISLNRKQTRLQPDGSFRMVLAHRNPGVPNWLDTEGRPSGILFWRFVLPEEPIVPLRAHVVPMAQVAQV